MRWLGAVLPPALASLYLTLVIPAGATDLVRLRDVGLPLGVTLGVAAGGWVLGYGITRDARKAAVASLLVVTAFGTFGYLHRLLSAHRMMPFARGSVLLLVYAVAIASTLLVVRRSPRRFDSLLQFCSILGVLLVGFTGARLARKIYRSATAPPALTASTIAARGSPAYLPDIYLIVPDKYTGSALLRANYGFDNSGFVRELERRGFVVPAMARANYAHTFLSLASMLNARYLEDLPGRFGVASDDWTATYPMIESNELAAFLRARGYEFVFFPTAFGATRQNRFADLQLPPPEEIRSELITAWYRTTAIPALRRLCRRLGCSPGPPYVPETAEMLDWKLGQLGHLDRGGKPLFVVAHLTMPHEPYLFRSDCSARPEYWPERDNGKDSAAVKAAYLEQIGCLNRKLVAVVDSILVHSPRPAVILIQADHGHGRLGRKLPSLDAVPAPQVAERLSVFAAYRLPGMAGDEVVDSVTPINVVRLVLRRYFQADLPPLPDASYWSSAERPYDFKKLY
jgi:hypothetical protein